MHFQVNLFEAPIISLLDPRQRRLLAKHANKIAFIIHGASCVNNRQACCIKLAAAMEIGVKEARDR